jgi:cytidine deaminase
MTTESSTADVVTEGDDVITDDELIRHARAQIVNAHAPYSKFRAGAIVVTTDGDEIGGTIVENVSLGLAMCAERVALFATVAAGACPAILVLAAPGTRGERTWPCGACLQVALELGGPALRILVGDDGDGPTSASTVGELLPRGPHIER